MYLYISMILMLLIISVQDIIKKQISLILIILLWVLGLINIIIDVKGMTLLSIVLGVVLLGGGTLFVSVLTNEAIGKGDALVIGGISLFVGFEHTLIILFISALIACVISIVLLVLRAVNKRSRIPYVPFIFIGNIIMIIMQYD